MAQIHSLHRLFVCLSRLKRQIFEASQSINSVVAALQTPSSSSSSSNNSIIKHPLSIPSDFSSSPSSSSPVSSKVHHRFDPASFYELASLAAAHAAAAFHHNKSQHSPATFQGFAKSLTTPTAVWLRRWLNSFLSFSFSLLDVYLSLYAEQKELFQVIEPFQSACYLIRCLQRRRNCQLFPICICEWKWENAPLLIELIERVDDKYNHRAEGD